MVDDSPKHSGLQNLLSIPVAVWKGITPSAETSHHLAAMVGLLTIVVLVLWNKLRWKPMQFLPGSLIAIVLASVVAWYYTTFGRSLSNRGRLASILPVMAMIIVLIISVVKSSLALSLGLVGALSIVRYRTAIKEPEELMYIFLAFFHLRKILKIYPDSTMVRIT
jgi:MFS superfamily sulfate permease-like transporter